MPGFITHYICGEATLNALPQEIRGIIRENRQIYNIGTQGPDIFFYYLPGLLKRSMKNIGIHMHQQNFRAFMRHLLEALKDSKEPEAHVLFSYICGYLTHYALDVNAHPFIYYHSDATQRSIQSSVRHRSLETAIDVMMLKLLSGEKPSDKKLWQLIHVGNDDARIVAIALRDAINKSYSRQLTERDVSKAMGYMTWITRILQSKNGRRKRFMELAEDLTVGEHIVSCIIHDQSVSGADDHLNINKKPWHLPWRDKNDEDESSRSESFVDLYNTAIGVGVKYIEAAYSFKEGETDIGSLLYLLGNRSLSSGLHVDDGFVEVKHSLGEARG